MAANTTAALYGAALCFQNDCAPIGDPRVEYALRLIELGLKIDSCVPFPSHSLPRVPFPSHSLARVPFPSHSLARVPFPSRSLALAPFPSHSLPLPCVPNSPPSLRPPNFYRRQCVQVWFVHEQQGVATGCEVCQVYLPPAHAPHAHAIRVITLAPMARLRPHALMRGHICARASG